MRPRRRLRRASRFGIRGLGLSPTHCVKSVVLERPRMSTKILLVAGARPNFMKIAPLMRVLGNNPAFVAKLVHTGQHYDDKLSKIFFDDLKIPRPDIELEVGSGSHAQQTAEIIKRFE